MGRAFMLGGRDLNIRRNQNSDDDGDDGGDKSFLY